MKGRKNIKSMLLRKKNLRTNPKKLRSKLTLLLLLSTLN